MLFSHRVEHCRRLEADVRRRLAVSADATGLLLGGAGNEAEFARTRAAFKDGSAVFAAGTYQAIGYGMDLPSVARGVATTPIHSNRSFFGQVRGRLCRRSEKTGKTDARLYVLWDVGVYGRRPLENMCRWNKRVLVRDERGAWVSGRTYLEAMRDEAKRGAEDRSDDAGARGTRGR